MANGCLCKYCGHQETAHTNFALIEEGPSKRLSGYKKSLARCPGFVYSKEDLKEATPQEEDDFLPDPLESLGRSRGAWGMFMAECAVQKTEAQALRLQERYRSFRLSSREKKEIEKEMEDLRRPHGPYYIG